MDREEKFRIKPFKEDKTSVWYGYRHYKLVEGKVEYICGGLPCEESKKKVEVYFKRKKLL